VVYGEVAERPLMGKAHPLSNLAIRVCQPAGRSLWREDGESNVSGKHPQVLRRLRLIWIRIPEPHALIVAVVPLLATLAAVAALICAFHARRPTT
jgi:hypothetical protein